MIKEFIVEKCKWKNDCQSPVVLMIDDLANKWIDIKNTSECVKGSDWGYLKKDCDSFFHILNNQLLNKYPYVKCTLFLVVGRREGIIKGGNNYLSYDITENGFSEFLKELCNDERFELAYHGLTHGICGDTREEFVEEWNTYSNLEEAIKKIEIGKKIFKDTVGVNFNGGKYCGYCYNDFSDESIVKTNFKWWCRHWDSILLNNYKIKSNVLSLQLDYFNDVIDIPSTIDGSFYSLKSYKKYFQKNI
ncbi:hypothetical protein [Aminipila terrae]|uniref:Uncharacterized protein n=1 Tax=Aminipila terrae TaxID=2697030 RepID=A0A6P1MBJ6_9FIRM|nr:hypothetical protein [Aminipila terrae]QHI71297.1 hypothetical protein Ami3637_01800 [Aminipila terrae]